MQAVTATGRPLAMTISQPIAQTTPPDGQAAQADDTPTLIAAGILSYVVETMLHEALGHGGVCLAQGHRFTLLAPLWMRCSDVTPLMVAAGPAANVLAALICFGALRLFRPAHPVMALLLWLSFAFNALVACGYLAVGAATGFGDWPALFAHVDPAFLWRMPAVLIAVFGYYLCLGVAAWLFRRQAGHGPRAQARLWRRAVWSASGAAFVACAAEIAGGRAQPMPLALALGCTLAVGFSLTSLSDAVFRVGPADADLGPVARSPVLIALALAVALVFVILIGPGFDVTKLI
jgi:hypothetical protein